MEEERRDQEEREETMCVYERDREEERERGKERGKETEDRLHIKWTGNEPGYIESVGKSVCRGASLCEVCPPFYLAYISFT